MTPDAQKLYHVFEMITIAYNTLGCKVNQYETEKIRQALEGAGLGTVPFSSRADVYIINTCSVTSVADGKSRAVIRKAARTNPDAFVVVCGCYAELEPGQVAEIEGVDLVVPNDEKDGLAERIAARFGGTISESLRVEAGGKSEVLRQAQDDSFLSHPTIRPRTRTRAVVKVQDGCDQFCSYCVIPYARSRKVSRSIDDVMSELRVLGEFGYREIVLAGIRLGSYQHENARLPELVRRAAEVDGIERIRLSSIELWEIDDELLEVITHPKVCRHLHIPLQSGDDAVLRRMNRPYDSARYCEVIDKVRERVDGIGITTDVIVGFPGETYVEFDNTCALIERIDFSRLHVFRYSPRERTPAAEMQNQIDSEIKKQRAATLIELGKNAMRRFTLSQVGQTLDVLVETRDAASKNLTGFADNYVEVRTPGDAALKGKIIAVRITGVDQDGAAEGEIVES